MQKWVSDTDPHNWLLVVDPHVGNANNLKIYI